MATATETYTPRLKSLYERELRPRLKDELELKSLMQVPRIQKVTLNMGVGDAKTDSKLLDAAIEELTTIAGQRAHRRRGPRTAHRPRLSVRGRRKKGSVTHGQEVVDRQVAPPAKVSDACLHALQSLRPPACRFQEVRPLPDLPARTRASRLDSRHDQVKLVMSK